MSDEEEMDHSDACSDTIDDIRDSLADWATAFSTPLIALSTLSKDERTLLKTKITYNIETLASGMFHYFGIIS